MGLALTFDITFEPRHAMFIASVNPDSASPSLSLPRRPFVYSIRIRRKRCVLLSLERKNRQYPRWKWSILRWWRHLRRRKWQRERERQAWLTFRDTISSATAAYPTASEELGFAYPRRSIDHGRRSSITDGIADVVGIVIIPRLAPPFSFENYISLARYSR